MAKSKTLVERGKFKNEINSALYKNADIVELLLGDTTGKSDAEIRKEFKSYVKSHLFIDDTITEAKTFIFYDVTFPEISTTTKMCNVLMYLAQMVEDTLINNEEISNSFGIGRLRLDSVDIYNATRFYGCILHFDVPAFR